MSRDADTALAVTATLAVSSALVPAVAFIVGAPRPNTDVSNDR
jgi:hypothetical protein